MNHKIKLLEKFKRIIKGSNKLSLNNLEILINLGENEHVLGQDFLDLLEDLLLEDLITTENNWYYSITQKGLDYLDKYSE